jgi:hypothetical protein
VRFLSVALALCLVLALTGTALLVATHIHHGCTEASCPFCALLLRGGNLLRAGSASVVLPFFMPPVWLLSALALVPAFLCGAATLVRAKIRLNN